MILPLPKTGDLFRSSDFAPPKPIFCCFSFNSGMVLISADRLNWPRGRVSGNLSDKFKDAAVM